MNTPPLDVLLALQGVANVRKVQLRGRNAAISNAAETVWGPGSTYAKITTAAAMEVVSSSANDASGGSGAKTIVVEGLDSSYATVSETVTMNGVTAVDLANTYLAINRAYVATVGNGGVNAGAIDVRVKSGAVIKRQISAGATLGAGQDADFLYTIPAGYVGILKSVEFSGTGVTGDLTVYLNTIDINGVTRNEGAGKSSLYVTAFNGARGVINFGAGLVVPAKSLLELRAIVSAGAGDLVAMADLYLVNTALGSWGNGA